MDTAIHHKSSVKTPSTISDDEWKHYRSLNKIKLNHEPSNVLERLGVSSATIRRLAKEAQPRRHIKYSSEKPAPFSKWVEKFGEKFVKLTPSFSGRYYPNGLDGVEFPDGKFTMERTLTDEFSDRGKDTEGEPRDASDYESSGCKYLRYEDEFAKALSS